VAKASFTIPVSTDFQQQHESQHQHAFMTSVISESAVEAVQCFTKAKMDSRAGSKESCLRIVGLECLASPIACYTPKIGDHHSAISWFTDAHHVASK